MGGDGSGGLGDGVLLRCLMRGGVVPISVIQAVMRARVEGERRRILEERWISVGRPRLRDVGWWWVWMGSVACFGDGESLEDG